MSEFRPQRPAQGWYVARWPLLAWAETMIKLAALATGVMALVSVLDDTFALPEGARLVQFGLMIVLSAGLVFAILDRFIEREVVAMLFVIANNIGHWCMVAALASDGLDGSLVVVFGTLMLVGDLVKLAFIRHHRFTVRDVPPVVIYGLTLGYVGGYALLLLLEVFA
jgi:hypothetical protein